LPHLIEAACCRQTFGHGVEEDAGGLHDAAVEVRAQRWNVNAFHPVNTAFHHQVKSLANDPRVPHGASSFFFPPKALGVVVLLDSISAWVGHGTDP
jgi:hypothetical protein